MICERINAADGFDLISQNGSHLFTSLVDRHNNTIQNTLLKQQHTNSNIYMKRRTRRIAFNCTLTNARQNATDLNYFSTSSVGSVGNHFCMSF